ncbi:MAG: hypothetical protein QHC78_17960 [Pigmentiphaga sp.]|uniref:hypothetical protein n=1 Tax=Pigmentiphaga sp. TaxID=1977564 RepID=UPI0029ADD62E|nr:hypothetical protein [Pigmentiphaga sp.]MDX3907579.1 hypothetical protein [Pigmentiphaga sp.]
MVARSMEFPAGRLRARMLRNVRSYARVSISVSSSKSDRILEQRMAEWLRKELVRGDLCAREFFVHRSAGDDWRHALYMACAAMGHKHGGFAARAQLDGVVLCARV